MFKKKLDVSFATVSDMVGIPKYLYIYSLIIIKRCNNGYIGKVLLPIYIRKIKIL